MNYKLWILIIACLGIVFILVLDCFGYKLIGIVSNSMKHEDETFFLQFWEGRGYDAERVREFPLSKGFQGGDLLVLKKTSDYEISDVLGYQANCVYNNQKRKYKCSKIIVHRLTDLNETEAIFIEDNLSTLPYIYYISSGIKEEAMSTDEIVKKDFIVGKIILKIPKLGLITASLNCWIQKCNYIDCITNGNCN